MRKRSLLLGLAIAAVVQASEPGYDERTVEVLGAQLQAIVRVVPRPALEKIQAVPIWIHRHSGTSCMAFHPSEDGLKHGLAHAYQFRVLGFDSKEIERCWGATLASGKHDQVNSKEYFCGAVGELLRDQRLLSVRPGRVAKARSRGLRPDPADVGQTVAAWN